MDEHKLPEDSKVATNDQGENEINSEEDETPRERRKRLRREIFDEHKVVCCPTVEDACQAIVYEICHIRDRLDAIEEKLSLINVKEVHRNELDC